MYLNACIYRLVECVVPIGTTVERLSTSNKVASVYGRYGRSSNVGSLPRPTTCDTQSEKFQVIDSSHGNSHFNFMDGEREFPT